MNTLHYQNNPYPRIPLESLTGRTLAACFLPTGDYQMMEDNRFGLILCRFYTHENGYPAGEHFPLVQYPELYALWNFERGAFVLGELEQFAQQFSAEEAFAVTPEGDIAADNLVKILLADELAESVWATQISESLYRIQNVPFFSSNYHFGDVVIAISQGEDIPEAVEVFTESGYRTLSITAPQTMSEDGWKSHPVHAYLNEIGWSGEGGSLDGWFLVLPVKEFEDASQITEIQMRFPDLTVLVN